MNLLAAVLFVVAAFAGNGHALLGWNWNVWVALGFAAWVLSSGVSWPPTIVRERRK